MATSDWHESVFKSCSNGESLESAGAPEKRESNVDKSPARLPTLSSEKREDNQQENRARNAVKMEKLEAQFASFCQTVPSLDEKMRRNSMRLFQEAGSLLVATTGALGSGTEEHMVRLWSVCIIYCASKLSPDSSEAPLCKLCDLLRIAKVSISEFLRELPQFLQKSDSILDDVYGDVRERLRQVKDLQANFVHLTGLFNYYKRNYDIYFLPSHTAGRPSSSTTADGTLASSYHLQFGWMLFLALRTHVLSQFDLVTCTNGLIAVLVIMITHMPVHLRNFSFRKSETFAIRSPAGVNIVASLCNLYEALEEDVQRMVEKASDMIEKLLGISSDIKLSNHLDKLADTDTEGLMLFDGLLEANSLHLYLELLNKDYEEVFKHHGELDERIFLNGDDAVVGMISDSTTAVDEISSGTHAKRKHEIMMSPGKTIPLKASMLSPHGSPRPSPIKASCTKMLPPTPITSTMISAKWLRTIIAPSSLEPSPELSLFLRSCDTDITKEVKTRAQVLLEAIFTSQRPASWGIVGGMNGTASLDSIWAEQRRSEAVKLYYRVLGCMCRVEAQRLHCDNLSALLVNERFHRCMLACSAELVLATYKTVSLNFPAILELTGITAFDMWKVIESFVRHEETLPRELKRHLNSIEEKILEKLAWENGSSMYNSLIVAKPRLQSEIYQLDLLAEPMPSLDTVHSRKLFSDGSAQTLMLTSRVDLPLGNSRGLLSPLSKVSTSSAAIVGASEYMDKAGSGFISPVKGQPSAFSAVTMVKVRLQPPLQSAFASPQRPSSVGGGETCAETVINVFFQKVLKLAAIRTKNLCESLRQLNFVMEDVYRTVQHLLYNETSLFFRRHIDQIILCSMYGVCKVKQLNVTFKQIVQNYKQNPHDSHIYRTVSFNLPTARPLVKGGQSSGDIISFYNAIFVPASKGFLMQLNISAPSGTRMTDDGEETDSQRPGSPGPSPFSSLPDMSPKKVSANHNVFVSPLRSSKVESLRPPHSRSLYACVGESTHAYQSPSKDLSNINNRVNSRHLGRIDFGDAGLVSDSLVAGSLCPSNMNVNINQLKSNSVLSQSQLFTLSNSTVDTLLPKRLCMER